MRLWHKKQITTPIFIKDHNTGLYEPIPYDKMIQFPNGKWGITFITCHRVPLDFLNRHLDHFEYQPGTDTWMFTPDRKNYCPTKVRSWGNHLTSAALGANTVMLAFNLWMHEYLWAIPQVACIGLLLTCFRRIKR